MDLISKRNAYYIIQGLVPRTLIFLMVYLMFRNVQSYNYSCLYLYEDSIYNCNKLPRSFLVSAHHLITNNIYLLLPVVSIIQYMIYIN